MIARQSTCVAFGGRGVLIEGPPGSGKSSLALALIDRGAVLVGDDGVMLAARDGRLIATPHPATQGLLEVRNLGLVPMPSCEAPVALVVELAGDAPRFIDAAGAARIAGVDLPLVRLFPETPVLHLRVELALRTYGLSLG